MKNPFKKEKPKECRMWTVSPENTQVIVTPYLEIRDTDTNPNQAWVIDYEALDGTHKRIILCPKVLPWIAHMAGIQTNQ